jgi:divalent metal cation (Fe/Co/Zn/Cd) transporter
METVSLQEIEDEQAALKGIGAVVRLLNKAAATLSELPNTELKEEVESYVDSALRVEGVEDVKTRLSILRRAHKALSDLSQS